MVSYFFHDENDTSYNASSLINQNSYFDISFSISDKNNSILVKKGETFSLNVSNFTYVFSNNFPTKIFMKKFDTIKIAAVSSSGQYSYFTPTFTWSSNTSSGTLTLGKETAKTDIIKFIVTCQYYPTLRNNITGQYNLFVILNDNPFTPKVDISSEEAGLLSGLLGKVTEIFDRVKQTAEDVAYGFANVVQGITDGFSNVVNGILELPQKLWTLISDGLKNLFVPDEEYMTEYSDKWDELLSSRFGAIYESGAIIRDFFTGLDYQQSVYQIELPEVSLDSVGIPFTFGGYKVDIVPSKFGKIAALIKNFTGAICTLLFVNGLRKRYDEVMGVRQ